MSYIVTNKWLRAGYGEPLRGYFASEGVIEEIVDFGHAPIFEDADVFPCIVLLRKPGREETEAERGVHVIEFPREALNADITAYVEEHAHTVPKKRFGKNAWSLETSAVDDLMEKIRANGVPLAEFAGVKPLYGIKTGLNEAFLIDTLTKERLVREDPRSAEVIKPYLRGQDIKRWSPEWQGLWIVVLKSSGDHIWPWTEADDAEEVFRQTYPSLHAHMKPLEAKLRKRQDQGHYWWELRSCTYYDAFEKSKIIHTDITWRPQFAFVEKPGQKLDDFPALGPDAFGEEVRKRRTKGEGRLTPGTLRDLKSGYAEMAEPVRQARTEAAGLERRLSDLVNQAYNLTAEEVELLWKTAPPRMPRLAYGTAT